MTNQFKVGDVVELKSGGPAMTVTDVRTDAYKKPIIDCAWFQGVKQFEGTFPPDALKIAEDPMKGQTIRPYNPGGQWQ